MVRSAGGRGAGLLARWPEPTRPSRNRGLWPTGGAWTPTLPRCLPHPSRCAAKMIDTGRDSGVGPVAAGSRRREARTQRLRQPCGTACHFLSPARPDNLTALGLRHDQILERIAVADTVDAGLEVRSHRADQGCGRPEVTRRNVDVLVEEGELGYAHLVGAEQGLHHEDAVPRAQRRESLTLPERDVRDGDAAGARQRVPEQDIGPSACGRRLYVVAPGPHDRVYLVGRGELQDLDLAGGGQREVGHFLVCQHYHAAGRQLVPPGDLRVRYLCPAGGADSPQPDLAAIVLVHLAERDLTLHGRGVQLHRDPDHAETDCGRPYAPHSPAPSPANMRPVHWVLSWF